MRLVHKADRHHAQPPPPPPLQAQTRTLSVSQLMSVPSAARPKQACCQASAEHNCGRTYVDGSKHDSLVSRPRKACQPAATWEKT